jgi:hypothetical protein
MCEWDFKYLSWDIIPNCVFLDHFKLVIQIMTDHLQQARILAQNIHNNTFWVL